DGEVDHLRADEAEVAHVRASVGGAVHHSGCHRGRRDAHVTTHGDRARLEVLDVGPPDRIRTLLVELGPVEAADVVGLEDLRLEHGPIVFDAAALRLSCLYAYPAEMERRLTTVL